MGRTIDIGQLKKRPLIVKTSTTGLELSKREKILPCVTCV